jgi:hypothetical protein
MSRIDKHKTYNLSVFDKEIDQDLQTEVYEYLLDSEYCVNFYDHNHSLWYPRENKWITPRTMPGALRLPLAWDEQSLEHRSPIVYKLWLAISASLDNKFEIAGTQEGLNYMTGISPLSGMTRVDGTPGRPNCGWRVYGSGHAQELGFKARTKSVHRDSVDMNEHRDYTLVYFANQEWHPQYYGETLFHSNDNITGDHTSKFTPDQPREFPIGEAENFVAPMPGRFMLYDGRYLHQVKPVAHYSPEPTMGVVFRIRLKEYLEC